MNNVKTELISYEEDIKKRIQELKGKNSIRSDKIRYI